MLSRFNFKLVLLVAREVMGQEEGISWPRNLPGCWGSWPGCPGKRMFTYCHNNEVAKGYWLLPSLGYCRYHVSVLHSGFTKCCLLTGGVISTPHSPIWDLGWPVKEIRGRRSGMIYLCTAGNGCMGLL